jgi:cell division protein FtsQ
VTAMILERDADGGPGPKTRRGPAARPRGAHPGPPARPAAPWKAAVFALAVLAILVGTVWALLGSSLLVVRSVTVTGIRSVSRAEVIRAAGVAPGTPLIRINTAAVASRVERIAQIQSAQVSRHWPDSIVIAVRERTPALAVASGNGFALIDRFGVVVTRVTARPAGMALLVWPGNLAALRGSPAVQAVVTVLRQLPPQLRSLVRAVSAASATTVTLDLRHRITVLWGGTDRPAAKAAELAILMRTKAAFYDLSDPGAAVTGGE